MMKAYGGWVLAVALAVGCSGGGAGATNRSFDQELQLTLRAGRGELSDAEKVELLKENHPLLAQVADPLAFRLCEYFARLPASERERMLENSYVKWRMSELDSDTQELTREMVRVVLQMRKSEASPFDLVRDPQRRRMLMESTEIGFAVVELDRSQQKVVSWFAFSPELPMPLWVTIVNADASGLPEYVQAHLQRLPLLRSFKPSAPPKPYLHPASITSLV
jgi:hypothetical protein